MKTAAELAAGGLANAKGTGQLDKMMKTREPTCAAAVVEEAKVGLSDEELARKLGCTASWICQMRFVRRIPSFKSR